MEILVLRFESLCFYAISGYKNWTKENEDRRCFWFLDHTHGKVTAHPIGRNVRLRNIISPQLSYIFYHPSSFTYIALAMRNL